MNNIEKIEAFIKFLRENNEVAKNMEDSKIEFLKELLILAMNEKNNCVCKTIEELQNISGINKENILLVLKELSKLSFEITDFGARIHVMNYIVKDKSEGSFVTFEISTFICEIIENIEEYN